MLTDSIVRLGLVTVAGALLGATPAPAQGPGGFGGMGGAERELVARYDANGDERLDAAERATARAAMGTQASAGGFGGGMRGGFPGGPPPGRFGGGRGGGGFGGGERLSIVPGTPGAKVEPSGVQTYPETTSLYDPTALRTIFLHFENADWEAELAAFNNTDVEVPATVIVDGQSYGDVGVHFRGASSYAMVPAGNKRSLNLAFDFVNEDQRLLGYKTLNLLNANNDPTFLRTVLYSQIARDYIVAPKVNFVRVVINGEDWGVYVNQQQYNKDLVGDFFDGNDGARWTVPGSPNGRGGLAYLGEDPAAYSGIYEIKTKDDEASWAKLIELTRVLNQTPADRLEAALEPVLDVDGALKFLALEVALGNSDGYWSRASDYNIYLDEEGRFHLFPHDMNEAMSGNAQLDPLVSVSDPNKALRAKLLAVPALRERYLGYVAEIATEWLDWNRVGPIVEEYRSLIGDEVEADTRKLYGDEAFHSGVDSLKSWMEARRAFLLAR